MSTTENHLRENYEALLEEMRAEHKKHDELEEKAQQAATRSYRSYEKLGEMRARACALRAAYAALTDMELDYEMAKAESSLNERKLLAEEKKERHLPPPGMRRTPRPEYINPGSVVREREAVPE